MRLCETKNYKHKMNLTIKELNILGLDLTDEKTLKYLIGLCECEKDFRNLLNETRFFSKARKMVKKSLDEYIIQQIRNCKSFEQFMDLFDKISYDLRARKMVKKALRKFVNSKIQKL